MAVASNHNPSTFLRYAQETNSLAYNLAHDPLPGIPLSGREVVACGQPPLFYGKDRLISTRLPNNIAIIRIVVTVAFTVLLAALLKSTFFCWPVLVLGVAFAGRTAYANLLSEDPLIKTFHSIVGGKAKFEKLPTIDLQQQPTESLYYAVKKLDWQKLIAPIYQTKTSDGRQVVIVKGCGQTTDFGYNNTRAVFAFVEKARIRDICLEFTLTLHNLASIFNPFARSSYGERIYCNDFNMRSGWSSRIVFCSDITTNIANDFYTQLNSRQ